MTSKNYFGNSFLKYSNTIDCHLLNESRNGISDEFCNKLNTFKNEKLFYLTTNLQKYIFHNETVYTGSAGLALFYLMESLSKNEASQEMLQQAFSFIDITSLKGRRISFLCGDAGPISIATVISYKLGDSRPKNLPEYKSLVQRLMNLSSLINESPNELLYGRVGYLFALLFVNKYVSEGIPVKLIEQVIVSVIKSGRKFSQKMKSESPLLWQWHDKVYFGAAHGMAGILYILLECYPFIKGEERIFLKPSIDWLLDQQFPSGNFPSSLSSNSGDRLVQWCHGAPGFVPLCLLAYKTYDEEKYLNIAIQCGDVVWLRGLCTKGYSICHGVSGNAYAFLQLYQATKEPVHLYRACCFMEWCMLEQPGTEQHHPDRPASLFEGLLGRIYLAADILDPFKAKFPAFCL